MKANPTSNGCVQGRDERSGADRCWIYRDGYHYAQVAFSRPDPKLYPTAIEYMRVLSRAEVDKLWQSQEDVDGLQLVNSLMRTVEGQRKHIARLQQELKEAESEKRDVATEARWSERQGDDYGSF